MLIPRIVVLAATPSAISATAGAGTRLSVSTKDLFGGRKGYFRCFDPNYGWYACPFDGVLAAPRRWSGVWHRRLWDGYLSSAYATRSASVLLLRSKAKYSSQRVTSNRSPKESHEQSSPVSEKF